MKRSQKSARKIKLLLLLMLITTILAITATYAWFSSQREVDISGIKLNVEVAESMQISLDGATWYQSITVDDMRQFYGTYSDTTKPHADKDTNTNYVPTELIPASTVGTVSSGKLQFMTGDATLTGTVTSATVKPCNEDDLIAGADIKTEREANNENHPYLVFDMYLRNYSQNPSDPLQLKAGSRVWVDSTTAETQEGKGKEGTGLENCARVGFVIYDNTADVTASATDIRGLTATTPQVVIWEPNHIEHIAEVISSGRARANTRVTTYGVKYSSTEVTIANVDAGATDTTNLSEQYTFITAYNRAAPTDADDPLLLETTDDRTMTTSAATPENVTIAANKVTKVRVYIWLEGQDVDCINTASQGDRLQVNLKLTKPESEGGTENTYVGDGSESEISSADEITAADYGGIVTNYTPTNGVNDEGIKWKIFHSDGTNIYLIADDYVPVSYVPKAKGNSIAVNTEYANNPTYNFYLTDIAEGTAYAGTSDIASSLRTKWLSKYAYSSTEYNAKATAYLLDTNQWSGFKDSSGYADYAVGGPTLELFVASYNTTHTDYTIDTQASNDLNSGEYGYQLKWSGNEFEFNDWGNVVGIDYTESLYIIGNNDRAYAYWVASPSASNAVSIFVADYFSEGDFSAASLVNCGCLHYFEAGARPVVSLNSSVKIEKTGEGTYKIVE